ncbi:hypothetical protein MLD63_13025 [Paracoccus sp. TK19116]|uniref:Inner membrane protein n=1 Tax=Paracoccus albicereus TaxID=2922394 RepID=A0ABT1MUI2_9RHOB|nr:hypothetical protein [Paracoccus albicereus]MCQ0971344.1 hypothetical protein [Paracoccus albicereus]
MKKPTEADETTPKKNTRKKPADQEKTVTSTPVDAAGSDKKEKPDVGPVQPASSALVGEAPGDGAIPATKKKTTEPWNAGEASSMETAPANRGSADASASDNARSSAETPPDLTGPAREEATPAESEPITRPSEPPVLPASGSADVKHRSGFWPLVLGGVIAAGLGSAVTIVALPSLPPGWLPQSGSSDNEALLAEARSAAEDAARNIIADMPEGADTTPELQAAIEAQAQRIDTLAQSIEQSGGDGQSSGAQDVAALQARLEEMAQQMQALSEQSSNDAASDQAQALNEQVSEAQEQIRAAAEEATQQIEAARAEAESLQQAAEESTRRAEAIAAVAALQNALDQGVSTEAAIDDLREAGIEPPAAVTAEAPTLATLQENYDPAARQALRAALRDGAPDEGAGGVIANFLRAQTGARSVEPRQGDDPDAVLSRAGAAVAEGDIQAALSELDTLPEPARNAPAMAEWLAGAQAHTEARAAVAELAGGGEPVTDAAAGSDATSEADAATPEAADEAGQGSLTDTSAGDEANQVDAEAPSQPTSAPTEPTEAQDGVPASEPTGEPTAAEQPAAEPAPETN